jgi:hypothetical protein
MSSAKTIISVTLHDITDVKDLEGPSAKINTYPKLWGWVLQDEMNMQLSDKIIMDSGHKTYCFTKSLLLFSTTVTKSIY